MENYMDESVQTKYMQKYLNENAHGQKLRTGKSLDEKSIR